MSGSAPILMPARFCAAAVRLGGYKDGDAMLEKPSAFSAASLLMRASAKFGEAA